MRAGRGMRGYLRGDDTELGVRTQQFEDAGGEIGFGGRLKLPGGAAERKAARARQAVDASLEPARARSGRDILQGSVIEAKRITPKVAKRLADYKDSKIKAMGDANEAFYQSPRGQQAFREFEVEGELRKVLDERSTDVGDVAFVKNSKLREALAAMPGEKARRQQARLQKLARDRDALMVELEQLGDQKLSSVKTAERQDELLAQLDAIEFDAQAVQAQPAVEYDARRFDEAMEGLAREINFARNQDNADPALERLHAAMMRDRAKWGDDWVAQKSRHAQQLAKIDQMYHAAGVRGMDINPDLLSPDVSKRIEQTLANYTDDAQLNALADDLGLDFSDVRATSAAERIKANSPRETVSKRGLTFHGSLHNVARFLDPFTKIAAQQSSLRRTANMGRLFGGNAEEADAVMMEMPRATMDFILLQRRRAKEQERDGTD